MLVEGPQTRVVVIGGERQTQTAKQSSGVGASWVWSGGWQLWAQQREVQRKCSAWRGRVQGVCLAVSVSSAWGGMERAGVRAQPAGRPTTPTHKADNKLGGRWKGKRWWEGRKAWGSRRAPQPYRGLGD